MPRQNTPPANYPQAVLKQIEQLAQNIVIARKRRGESQAQWAKKLGISQPTMVRIERGDPSVAMASYVMCMWLINPAGNLAELVAPQNDHAALEKEVARVRSKRKLKPQVQPQMSEPNLSVPASFAAAQKASENRAKSLEPLQRHMNAAAKPNEPLKTTKNLAQLLEEQAGLAVKANQSLAQTKSPFNSALLSANDLALLARLEKIRPKKK